MLICVDSPEHRWSSLIAWTYGPRVCIIATSWAFTMAKDEGLVVNCFMQNEGKPGKLKVSTNKSLRTVFKKCSQFEIARTVASTTSVSLGCPAQ